MAHVAGFRRFALFGTALIAVAAFLVGAIRQLRTLGFVPSAGGLVVRFAAPLDGSDDAALRDVAAQTPGLFTQSSADYRTNSATDRQLLTLGSSGGSGAPLRRRRGSRGPGAKERVRADDPGHPGGARGVLPGGGPVGNLAGRGDRHSAPHRHARRGVLPSAEHHGVAPARVLKRPPI
jgi:hypothetical protein